MEKEAEKAKKVEEAKVNKTKQMAKRAQDFNKTLKERQRIVAIDRKKHIKESLAAYQQRLKKSKSAEKVRENDVDIHRLDKLCKMKVEEACIRVNNENQDIRDKLQAYFVEYQQKTDNAAHRRESNVKEQTKNIRKRLAKTSEVHIKAKQGIFLHTDALSDQLIKKMLKNEETLKAAKIKKTKQIEDERKKLTETINDKKKKVKNADKIRQKQLQQQFASEQERVTQIEENIQKFREEKQYKLKNENIKWKEYFLRALEISESNVG